MALRTNIISTLIISIVVFSFLIFASPEKGFSQSQLGCCLDLAGPECLDCEGECASLAGECGVGFLHNSFCGSDGASCVVAQGGDLGCCVRPNNLCLDDVGLEICEGFEGVEWVFDASCSTIPQCPRQTSNSIF